MKKPYEENGCLYLFNNKKLNNLIDEIKRRESIPKYVIMEKLAADISYNVESVRKWIKDVSPDNIDSVKSIANHLEINYLELLIPLDNQEETVKNDKLTNEIRIIFKRCVEVIYKRSDTTSFNSRQEFNNFLEEIKNDARDIHKLIDQLSLDIDDETRMKLHIFLFEFESTFSNNSGICERWLEITDKFTFDYNYVPSYTSFDRLTAIEETRGIYLDHEIEYAERLGFTDIKMIPEEIWDKYDQTEDVALLEQYGAPYITDYVYITPQMVYADMMINLIKEVIEIYFMSEDDTID